MKPSAGALVLFAYTTLCIVPDLLCVAQAPPSLATFSTYEDMHRYFSQRDLRSLRHLDNPTDDSYISAFNYHNEQPAVADVARPKRSDPRHLPDEPKLLKFEVGDAIEPSDEVKQLIREARQRELNAKSRVPKPQPLQPQMKTEAPKKKTKAKSKRSGRNKRSTQNKFNENVRMIKFDESDAREPDESMRAHFSRMRSWEIQKVENGASVAPKTTQSPQHIRVLKSTKNPKDYLVAKRRRVRRSAPHMFKFELEDARNRNPDETMTTHIRQNQMRESRSVSVSTERPHQPHNQSQPLAQSKEPDADSRPSEDNPGGDDQSNNESKRLYVYKEAPALVKVKKSLNTLPQELQKIITSIMKDNHVGKALVKHIPQQQMNYGYLKSRYGLKGGQSPVFGTPYFKYVQPQKMEQLQIQSVPVVENVRYVYHPVAVSGGHGSYPQQQKVIQQYVQAPLKAPATPVSQFSSISHPIVVPETSHNNQQQQQYQQQQQQTPIEVHHTYAADLSNVHSTGSEHFRPSKPDPLLQSADENKMDETEYGGLSKGYSPEVPVEHYKYELYTPPGGSDGNHAKAPRETTPHHLSEYHDGQDAAQLQSPVQIKIEYHAPADPIKDNYKELQEFKELSALMGKSPEDQIHGLTYLLAKEMQNKLQSHRQQKTLDHDALTHRPQDNTSPILFHPGGGKDYQLSQSDFKTHSGSIIAMGKSKLYVPIVEKTNFGASDAAKSDDKNVAMKSEAQAPTPSSYLEYKNSNKHTGQKVVVEQVIHHPTVTHHGHKQYPMADEGSVKASYGHGLNYNDETYASKYAFGYRIRDFYTGNDFGHKQNRDLDGVTRGQYHILLPDGRIQNVIYHADDTGFHADVSFESGH